jgi:hypothetical protein
MESKNVESAGSTRPELDKRVEERFGVVPNFSSSRPKLPRSLRNCGDRRPRHCENESAIQLDEAARH